MRGGPPAWGLDELLTTPLRKKLNVKNYPLMRCFLWRQNNPRRWEDNIKMDLQEVGGGRGDWMELAQDRDGWRSLVGTVRNFRVP